MKKPVIAINLRPQNYAGLAALGNRVVAHMTANAHFSSPIVALPVLQSAIVEVEKAIAAWGPVGNRGSHADVVALRNKTLALFLLLKAQSQYVQSVAQVAAGTDFPEMTSIITSSGFSLKGHGAPQGVLEAVCDFHRFISRRYAPNVVKLKWAEPLNTTSAGNVKSYRVLRGNTNVFSAAREIGTTTRTSFIDANNSDVVQRWSYFIVPVNSAGDGAPSEEVTVMVVTN